MTTIYGCLSSYTSNIEEYKKAGLYYDTYTDHLNYLYCYMVYQFWDKKIKVDITNLDILEFSMPSHANYTKYSQRLHTISFKNVLEYNKITMDQMLSLEKLYQILETQESEDLLVI